MKFNESAGFTIVEVIVSVAIFSIGILAVAMMQDRSMRSNLVSKKIHTASFLSSGEVEQISGLSYVNATDTNANGNAGLSDRGPNADRSLTVTENGRSYEISVNVSENDPILNVKTVNIIVSENNGSVMQLPYILKNN